MKRFLFYLLRGFMNFIYAVMKLLSIPRDRILFISRHSDTANENFLLIAEEIKKRSPHTELRFSCKTDKVGGFGFHQPFLMLDRMRLLAGSRVCITDSETAEIGILRHRREMRIIQIWHSMAPFKKFGWQVVDTDEGVSRECADGLKLHEGYDHIIVGSEFAQGIFSEAMNTDIAKILPLGLPLTDSMLHSSGEAERMKLWRLHPSACGKKIVVYAPTIRKGSVPCSELVSSFDYESSALIIKLHPRDKDTAIFDERAVVDTEMTTQEAIRAADVIITDYSGVAAEASLLSKPVFFYVPDIEEYSGDCGLNIDPCILFSQLSYRSADALIAAISEDCDEKNAQPIREKLAGACRGDSAKSIANLAAETSIQNTGHSAKSSKNSRLSDFIARCLYSVRYLGSKIDPMLILFESKQTRSFDGAVKELFLSLPGDKKFENCRFAWAVSDSDEIPFPDGVSVLVVSFGSSEHMQLHARAGIIISDAPVSPLVKLRSEQNYFIAGSGTKETLRRLID